LGIKKAFSLSTNWLNLHYFTPLFRIRWIIFENLFSEEGLFPITEYQNQTSPDDITSIYTKAIEKSLEDAQRLLKDKQISTDKYTQWLEWTLGFESSFLISDRAPLTLGFALGFRTSVEFWKERSFSSFVNEREKSKESSETAVCTGGSSEKMICREDTSFTKSITGLFNPTVQIHLTMPM